MTQVAIVSKEGFDATTETDPNNLVYSSEYNTLKYHQSGTIDVAIAGTTAEGTVSHDLGYIPFYVCLVNNYAFIGGSANNNFNMCPGVVRSTFPPPTTYAYSNCYAGTDNLYMRVDSGGITRTYTFRYFIFRNNTGL